MTREKLIELARETGLLTEHNYREIINFGSMVAAAEREACAVIAFNAKTYIEAANAIRARGQE